MEFYFSDANLTKDRFLKRKADEEPDGCMYFGTLKILKKILKLTYSHHFIIMMSMMMTSAVDSEICTPPYNFKPYCLLDLLVSHS